MSKYRDKLKKLLPSGYDALFSADKPKTSFIKNMSEEEWQNICELHQLYIDDFRSRPYEQLTNRSKEFFRQAVESFAAMKLERESR